MQEGLMYRMAFYAATAALALCAAIPAWADEEIGVVFEREFRGAEGMRTNGETRDLRWNGPVYSEETVMTGPDAQTELEFIDQTHLSVGSNSQVVLDSFVYDPSQSTGDAVITFGKGVFRFVTGDMNKDAYKLNTPSATLAIRGTIFQLLIDQMNNVIVYVEEGAVEIFPCDGKPAGVVTAGESGFVTATCSLGVRDGNAINDHVDDNDNPDSRESDGPHESGNTDDGGNPDVDP
jgi:hypothetical protein